MTLRLTGKESNNSVTVQISFRNKSRNVSRDQIKSGASVIIADSRMQTECGIIKIGVVGDVDVRSASSTLYY
jgi:ACT domain-containing protein